MNPLCKPSIRQLQDVTNLRDRSGERVCNEALGVPPKGGCSGGFVRSGGAATRKDAGSTFGAKHAPGASSFTATGREERR